VVLKQNPSSITETLRKFANLSESDHNTQTQDQIKPRTQLQGQNNPDPKTTLEGGERD